MMLAARLSHIKLQSLNLLFPPLCASCHTPVQDASSLCVDCWKSLSFIAGSCCESCGVKLPDDNAASMVCAHCISQPPAFDMARAALQYNEASRKLVHAFKYHDRQHVLPLLTRWLLAAGEPLIGKADMIIPVPLSRRRLFSRMFNQSALLAQALAKKTRLAYEPMLLARTRHTVPQAGLSRAERQRNLQGAFKVQANKKVKGRHMLLVDDVLTTGTTANACAKALKAAGAASVSVLAVARVHIEEV